ncbi:hypothetical protein [Streptomyces rubellomurinus]|uniref:Uncharacterized protein n=2 Tax=Streptomyces TaxID=1883 RepID=A0A0F2TFF3_STRR3|nr:hypothetical protein [Streptomyces rubellomurinus]KJS61904.1 hypothetical protein VM95_12125 [Streptomyces rubellomurinus]
MTTTISAPAMAALQQLKIFQSRKLEAKPGEQTNFDLSITAPGDHPVSLPFTAQTFTAPTGFVFDDAVPFVTYAYYNPRGEQGNMSAEIVADGKVLVLWHPIELNTNGKGSLLVYTLSMRADPHAQHGTYLDGSVTLGLYGGTNYAGIIDPA